jgi:hypothetical protein
MLGGRACDRKQRTSKKTRPGGKEQLKEKERRAIVYWTPHRAMETQLLPLTEKSRECMGERRAIAHTGTHTYPQPRNGGTLRNYITEIQMSGWDPPEKRERRHLVLLLWNRSSVAHRRRQLSTTLLTGLSERSGSKRMTITEPLREGRSRRRWGGRPVARPCEFRTERSAGGTAAGILRRNGSFRIVPCNGRRSITPPGILPSPDPITAHHARRK